MSEVYLGDTGTVFHFLVSESGTPADISSASDITIKFMRKDKTAFTRTGTFETDGTDGKIVYTSTADDIDQVGKWQTQIQLTMPAWTGHTSKATMDVLEPITAI